MRARSPFLRIGHDDWPLAALRKHVGVATRNRTGQEMRTKRGRLYRSGCEAGGVRIRGYKDAVEAFMRVVRYAGSIRQPMAHV